MEQKPRKVKTYLTKSGRCPFEDWVESIRNQVHQGKILGRIERLRNGHFGDCRSVGGGVYELRIFTGPGFRIYFGLIGADLVLLLGGGDKSSQDRDIKKCQKMLEDYNNG